jgi:hypothetical protein
MTADGHDVDEARQLGEERQDRTCGQDMQDRIDRTGQIGQGR